MAKSNTKGVDSSKATVVFKGPDTLIGTQGITQEGVSYITTNYGKALGFDSGKFVSTLEGIRFAISEYPKEKVEDIEKYHLQEIENFFSTTVIEANIVTGPGGLGIDVEVLYHAKDKATKIELNNKAKTLIGTPIFTKIVNQIPFYFWNVIQQSQSNLKKQKELEKKEAELTKKENSKLHKQPRGYLKTTARLVGKSTSEPTLFSLPTLPETKEKEEGNLVRDVISKNTAILGHYLLQLWQESGEKDLKIYNLTPVSEMMGVNNHELKIYLLYLGGYTYPIVDKDSDGLTLTVEQLFKVQFKYGRTVSEKYTSGGINKVGTTFASFIKDEPIEHIIVTPNSLFLNAMKGQGLGTVLAVNDKFVKMVLSLTDIAYKICSYSASNRPTQKIEEKKLVTHLGLEKQTKTQGKPRVRATILKGFQELEDKGHIKDYFFDEEKEMYSFTYSDRYIKHQHRKRDAIEPE
jgi:hypothetical protein